MQVTNALHADGKRQTDLHGTPPAQPLKEVRSKDAGSAYSQNCLYMHSVSIRLSRMATVISQHSSFGHTEKQSTPACQSSNPHADAKTSAPD